MGLIDNQPSQDDNLLLVNNEPYTPKVFGENMLDSEIDSDNDDGVEDLREDELSILKGSRVQLNDEEEELYREIIGLEEIPSPET